MTDTEQLAFITRVLEIYDEADDQSSLYWRTSMQDDPGLHLFATCNDFFYWATADAEEITPDNLPVLEQALVDLKALDANGYAAALMYLGELYAARVRRMRPQRPVLAAMSPMIKALFLTCGPERDPRSEG